MNLEKPIIPGPDQITTKKEIVKIEVNRAYENFLPQTFKEDPGAYFNEHGKQVKPGEITTYNEKGQILENPDSVKDFPAWTDSENNELVTVCKRINTERGETKKAQDPFYEYKILELLQELNLPAAKPIAKIEQNETCFIVMEKIPGLRWNEVNTLRNVELGFSEDDFKNLKIQVSEEMDRLKDIFSKAGIMRQPVAEMGLSSWEMKDMVFDINLKNKKLLKITPTDWEITTIDEEKVEAYKKRM